MMVRVEIRLTTKEIHDFIEKCPSLKNVRDSVLKYYPGTVDDDVMVYWESTLFTWYMNELEKMRNDTRDGIDNKETR